VADGRWTASVEVRPPDGDDADEQAITLPFTETFATAPAADAAALEAAIIWIDRSGTSAS
jgi:hypothetical protein